ncbi:hypothetical protein TNCV_4820771 [Trichonephila clavipes]|nr:hypothetical protein TNCV_4820771 [Trichonephila clavipes]
MSNEELRKAEGWNRMIARHSDRYISTTGRTRNLGRSHRLENTAISVPSLPSTTLGTTRTSESVKGFMLNKFTVKSCDLDSNLTGQY